MFRFTLRALSLLVPLATGAVFLAIAGGIYLWQNYTVISRAGDYVLATDRDLLMSHREDGAQTENPQREGDSSVESHPVARKVSLRKRAGLNLFERGHSALYETEYPEFPETNSFLRDVNRQVSRHHVVAATEFAVPDWSIVWDEFREAAYCNREWTGGATTDVIWVSDRAVSLLEVHHEYTGGAHGNYWYQARCYIDHNGSARELKLADLFEPSGNWRQHVVKYCANDLRRQGATALNASDQKEEPDSPPLDEDDLVTFSLAPSGLWFFFSPYHVGSYAEGAYSVCVPYAEIEPFLSDSSPVRLFMSRRITSHE